MPAGCHGHPAAAATSHEASLAPASRHPCPWCPDPATASGAHEADCGGIPKPTLDSRDAKNPVTPLLVALSAVVLGIVPLQSSAAPFAAADPVLAPATPAVDRYCRRLE
jgi:hypothetical protein